MLLSACVVVAVGTWADGALLQKGCERVRVYDYKRVRH